MAMDKAKHGGKKGAKAAAKGKKDEEKPQTQGPENCVVFVAFDYPDW